MAYPETKVHTRTIGTSASDNECPTNADSLVAIKNISANVVWISHDPGVAASVEGANCEPILAGEAIYVQWRPLGTPYSMIASAAGSKVVMVNAMDRT